MKFLSTIGLLSWIIFIADADADESDNRLSFFEILQGEWDVQRTVVYMEEGGSQHVTEPSYYHYSIAQDNETEEMALVGRFYQKDSETGEFLEDLELNVQFSSPGTGVFKTQSKYEFTIKPLFKFDFHYYANGVQLSHGEWEGEAGSIYQFQIPDYTTFTITVFPQHSPDDDANPSAEDEYSEDEEFISSRPPPVDIPNRCTKEGGCDDEIEVILYLGKKYVVQPEKSLLQRYGWVIIGGMIILNIYFQKKQRQPQSAPPPSMSPKVQRNQATGSKKSKKSD